MIQRRLTLFQQHPQGIHGVMKFLYFLTRQKRLLAASLVVFSTQHVTFRLVWALTHYKQVCVFVCRVTFSLVN